MLWTVSCLHQAKQAAWVHALLLMLQLACCVHSQRPSATCQLLLRGQAGVLDALAAAELQCNTTPPGELVLVRPPLLQLAGGKSIVQVILVCCTDD